MFRRKRHICLDAIDIAWCYDGIMTKAGVKHHFVLDRVSYCYVVNFKASRKKLEKLNLDRKALDGWFRY